MSYTIHKGDCLDVLKTLDDNSVDSIVTDPPYGLSFMGKAWDHSVPSAEVWAECLRVLKPGGHLLAFAGTRTQHRMAVNIEDAGFEIRDMIAWVYGSGFPKSLDVSKAIDRKRDDRADVLRLTSRLADLAEAAGIGRSDIDEHMGTSDMGGWWLSRLAHRCACPSVDNWTRLRDFIPGAPEMDAEVWRLNGRKGQPGEAWSEREVIGARDVPVGHSFAGETYGGDSSSQTVDITAPATEAAQQWQGWGTALKPALEPITVARKPFKGTVADNVLTHGTGAINVDGCRVGADKGRWPANLIHDGSDEVVGLFPQRDGGNFPAKLTGRSMFGLDGLEQEARNMGDTGSAARFFYCAKASKRDRDEGNIHPTVKPTDLMRYLVRLVTPPNGTVLDPFMGSGSTGKGATLEGFDFIGIELDAEYIEIARARIEAVDPENVLKQRGKL